MCVVCAEVPLALYLLYKIFPFLRHRVKVGYIDRLTQTFRNLGAV